MTWGQVRDVTFTLQAYGKIMKCALIRVNEPKLSNSFKILSGYLICNDPRGIYWQGTGKGHLRSCEIMNGLNPRPGGGRLFLAPSPDFSIYLQNRCADRHQTCSILPSINFPHCDKNISKGNHRLPANDVRVTSCSAVFGPKKGFAGRAVRPTALKIQKNVSHIKGVELLGL